MRLSFSSKVSLVVALVIVLGIVIHAAVEITVEANRKIEETINEKKLLTEVIASNFEFAGSPEGPSEGSPQGSLGGLRQLEGIVYIRVVNRAGEIIASSIEEENGTFISDPAISTNKTVVIHDVYDEESIVVIVSPTPDNYTLWLSHSLKKVYTALNEMMTNTIIVTLVVVAIFTPISYFIVSHSLRPLKKLTSLCGDVSKGKFDVRSNVQSKDEIGILSRTFDDMAGKLEKMREEIRRSERLSAIGQLATMVGHDLRNPLQSIENAAYVLNNEMSHLSTSVPNSQKAMEMLRVINDSVDYADKIVRDLHDFSAIKKPYSRRPMSTR